MMDIACRHSGFCGGSGGYVEDLIGKLERLDAWTFARIVLVAEGWSPQQAEYEVSWLQHFEQVFRDVFGDGEIALDAE